MPVIGSEIRLTHFLDRSVKLGKLKVLTSPFMKMALAFFLYRLIYVKPAQAYEEVAPDFCADAYGPFTVWL
jgi:hypothetical protein